MKKNLSLFALLFAFIGGAFAQQANDVRNNANITPIKTDSRKIKVVKKAVISGVNTRAAEVGFAEPVGLTNYDLQTNTNVARRLINHGGGVFSTAWTQYHGADLPGAPERGSGYNYNDGTGWQFTAFSGNTRIEGSQRTGWPALVSTSGNDYIINHYNGNGGYFGWKQTIGAANSSWATKHAGASNPLLWPRAVAVGDYVHVFGVVDNDVLYNGQQPAPIYMRSTDGGDTWGSLITMPGGGAADFASAGGDSYSIDATGSTVAVVMFGGFDDFVLWKSTDNGDNWTKTIIVDMPVDLYADDGGTIIDEDNDLIADTLASVSNATVVVDGNGMVHVAFTTLRVMDEDAGTAGWSYFPVGDNWINYWNDSMDAGVYNGASDMRGPGDHPLYMSSQVKEQVGWIPDLDGSGVLEIDGVGNYGQGWVDYPSLAVTPSNEIILTFSTAMEGDNYIKTDASPVAQSFRHIFMTKITWGDGSDAVAGQTIPVDVTSVDGAQAENIFCTLAKDTDADKAYIQYMWDDEPGVNMVAEDGVDDPVTDNYILFKSVNFSEMGNFELFSGVSDLNVNRINVTVFPNPTSDYMQVSNAKNSSIEIFNITGQKVLSLNDYNGGSISVSDLANGTYTVKVITNEGMATEKIQIIK